MSRKEANYQDQPQSQPKLPLRTRIIQLTFLIIAVGATIALAYWQFSRWNTTSSFQNLGYALQWPAFGLFFIWAYRQYMRYERERLAGDQAAAHKPSKDTMREIPDDILPQRPDGSDGAHLVDDRKERNRTHHDRRFG